MPWAFGAGGLKGATTGRGFVGDLVFSYGTSEGTFRGSVVYVVPEPGTLALPAGGLLLLRRHQRVA